MKTLIHKDPRSVLALAALGGMFLVVIGLTVALLLEAGGEREVVVVPGVSKKHLAWTGRVPDELLVDIAELFLMRYESYTPASVGRMSERLAGLVSPSRYEAFRQKLFRRQELARESGAVSCLSIEPSKNSAISRNDAYTTVSLVATTRLFVAGKPTLTRRLLHQITIQAETRTPDNPYGLFIAGHRTTKISTRKENGRAK